MGFKSDQLGVWFMFILLSPWVSLANDEGNALYAFKRGLKDPNNVLQSWDNTLVNPCNWFRITCDGKNKVTRVDVQSAGLSGPLTAGLGDLKNLQYLELFENNFYGKIPPEIGNLTNLVSLDLYSNSLTGLIPRELGKLHNLKFLRLQNNNLCGRTPVEVFTRPFMPYLADFEVYPGNPNLCNVFRDKYCKTCRDKECKICK